MGKRLMHETIYKERDYPIWINSLLSEMGYTDIFKALADLKSYKDASQQKDSADAHAGRYCSDCSTEIKSDEWCCPKCGGCL